MSKGSWCRPSQVSKQERDNNYDNINWSKKPTILREVIMEADTPTPSGIVYPKEVCEDIVKQINDNDHCCGTLDQTAHHEIDLAKVSHKIENAEFKDGKVWVDVKVISETRQGEILDKIIKNKVDIMFRPNSLVDYVDIDAKEKVVKNIKLISINALPKG